MTSPTPTLDLFAPDKRKAASDKALELIETRSIVTGSREGLYYIVSSSGENTYFVDMHEHSCTCKGYLHFGRCYHLVAADMLEDFKRKVDTGWIPSSRG